jgi:hypothetical protein
MTSPFDTSVAVPLRDEARVMRSIVRERGYWLSPMFRDLPLPPDKLPKEFAPVAARDSVARGYQIRSLRVVEEAPEAVEVALRSEEPAPRPAMRPAVPRVSKLDPDKKAEALARVTARAAELARLEAEREEAFRIKEANKPARRKEVIRAAQARHNERVAADAVIAKAEKARLAAEKGSKFTGKAIPNPHLVVEPPTPAPTPAELRDRAKTEAAVARFEARQAKKKRKDKRNQDVRTAKRRAIAAAAVQAKLEVHRVKLEAMKADPVLGPIFERYFAVKRNRATLHDRKHGVTSSEERLTTARLAAEAKLIEKMEQDPTYLETWNATRVESAAKGVNASYQRIRADPAKHAAYNERKRQRYYRLNGKPVPEVTESTLEAQLLRIYEKARREAERKNREGL